MMTRSSFELQAWNNAWANFRLISACEKLSQGEFEEERVSFFPAIKATLNHNLCVDRFYVDALEGGTLGVAAFDDDNLCSSAQGLKEQQRLVDGRLIAACAALGPEDLEGIVRIHRKDMVQEEVASRLLMHLFQHQVHHRGQVHAMLSGTSVKPPQLDEFFMSGERAMRDRAADLAALGWTEEMIRG
jgi:uncharacterized damage-inducible protein DinB